MRHLILSVVWIAVACTAIADEPNKDRVAMEKPSFVGKWAIAKAHPEDATKGAHWLLFTRDGTYAVLDKDGNELSAGTFEVVRTTTPRAPFS